MDWSHVAVPVICGEGRAVHKSGAVDLRVIYVIDVHNLWVLTQRDTHKQHK